MYIYVVRWKRFWSGKTSFAQRVLQGRKCYSPVNCDVGSIYIYIHIYIHMACGQFPDRKIPG